MQCSGSTGISLPLEDKFRGNPIFPRILDNLQDLFLQLFYEQDTLVFHQHFVSRMVIFQALFLKNSFFYKLPGSGVCVLTIHELEISSDISLFVD